MTKPKLGIDRSHIQHSVPAKSRDRGSAFRDPLAATGKQQTSTHVDRVQSRTGGRSNGAELVRGAERRGYVRNEENRRFSVEDATVADDGTQRVKEL